MKNLLIVSILTMLTTIDTFACLNGDSKVLKDGTYLYIDMEGNVPYGHFAHYAHKVTNESWFPALMKKLDNLYKATKDLDYLSDKGFLLILSKKYD